MTTTLREPVLVANGQGFWGDSARGPLQLVRGGGIHYLTMDYLAEVTMSIMQKLRSRNPAAGYATDFVSQLERILPECHERGIRIIAQPCMTVPRTLTTPGGTVAPVTTETPQSRRRALDQSRGRPARTFNSHGRSRGVAASGGTRPGQGLGRAVRTASAHRAARQGLDRRLGHQRVPARARLVQSFCVTTTRSFGAGRDR
jgi:hypothetical protein